MNTGNRAFDVSDVNNDSREETEDSTDEYEIDDGDDFHVDPAEIVEEFEVSVLGKGFEVVQEYYEVIGYIFRKTYSAHDWHHRLSVLESLLKVLDSLKSYLAKFLSRSTDAEGFRTQEDNEAASKFSDVLIMTTELIGFILSICEDDFNDRFYASVASHTDGFDVERRTEPLVLEDIDSSVLQCYEIVRRKALETFHVICTFPVFSADRTSLQSAVRFLWHPARADEDFLRLVVSAILKFMENPKFCVKFARLDSELRELFLTLRSVCIVFSYSKAAARMLVSATLERKFNEKQKVMRKYPFIEALVSVSKDGDLDHFLYYVYYFAMDSLHRWIQSQLFTNPIPNGFLLFIDAMAEHAPRIMAENIAPLIPLLDFDPSALRVGILSTFCSVLVSEMTRTRFAVSSLSMTKVRERMMDAIQEHLSDSAIQVRAKAVGFCIEIARHRRIPEISLRKGLLSDVAERLTENSGVIKRAAIEFFKVFLVNNPYERNLSRSYLLSQLELASSSLLNYDDCLRQFAEKFFDSVAPSLGIILAELIENTSAIVITDPGLEHTPLDEAMTAVMSLLFFPDSAQDALEVFMKLFRLGRFDNISRDQPKAELVVSLLSELRVRFLTILEQHNGVCDENANVVLSSQRDTLESFLITRKQKHLEDALCLHDQMCKLLPEVINSISVKDFADVSETLDFLVECCRFSIRGSETALLKLYKKVESISDISKAYVVKGIASLFLIKGRDGQINEKETTMSLLVRLKRVDECECYAVENLLSILSYQNTYPTRIFSMLFHVIETDEEDRILAMKALSSLAIGNAISMRKHMREFQKYVRCCNTELACEALRALSRLFSNISTNAKTEDQEIYRLRVFDSLFTDVEGLLFKLLLSDDGSDAATHWYGGMKDAIHLVFALSSEVDFLITHIAGKALWYAKRSANVLLASAACQDKETRTSVFFKKRRDYLNKKWQKTIERTLMLIGEIVKGVLIHVTGTFSHEMKRIAHLSEVLRQSNIEPEEDYGDFDENRSKIETDFAYEKGVFNLRPVRDVGKEIVASAIPNKSAFISNKEPFKVEPSDALFQQSNHQTTNSSNNENRKENPTTVDDLIRTHVNKLMESSLLQPYSLLGICLTFVVSCMRNSKFPKPIRDAAVKTFSVFLLASPSLAERGVSFLSSVLCSDPDPHIREYLLTSVVDILHRFPSMMESCALFLYRMASDEDVSVRLTAVLWLMHMLCNDMMKPRGSLSDVALCMITRESRKICHRNEKELNAAANNLFEELSKKGNLLLNVLPDIVCRLARYGNEVSMVEFKTLVRRLLEMVRDKPHDIMIEKMCQRFDFCSSEEATKDNENIAEYFSFFFSQLKLSEKSLRKVHSFLPQLAPLLTNDVFFNDLVSVIQSFLDSIPSTAAKEIANDLLRKINFLHKKSLNEDERNNFLQSLGSADFTGNARDPNDEEKEFTFDKCDQPVEY